MTVFSPSIFVAFDNPAFTVMMNFKKPKKRRVGDTVEPPKQFLPPFAPVPVRRVETCNFFFTLVFLIAWRRPRVVIGRPTVFPLSFSNDISRSVAGISQSPVHF